MLSIFPWVNKATQTCILQTPKPCFFAHTGSYTAAEQWQSWKLTGTNCSTPKACKVPCFCPTLVQTAVGPSISSTLFVSTLIDTAVVPADDLITYKHRLVYPKQRTSKACRVSSTLPLSHTDLHRSSASRQLETYRRNLVYPGSLQSFFNLVCFYTGYFRHNLG